MKVYYAYYEYTNGDAALECQGEFEDRNAARVDAMAQVNSDHTIKALVAVTTDADFYPINLYYGRESS